MSEPLESIERTVGTAPDAAVIWLHGLGADGNDFEGIVPMLRLPARLSLRFVFPHAPVRPVTINMGARMRAWYDIFALGGVREDEDGIRASQRMIEALIARERERGIASERIVLAGFSQGGAIALQTGLRHEQPLAGIMALSTYLPLASTLAGERSQPNAKLPILFAHGEYDEMIGVDRARASRDALVALGYGVQWKTYPMGHEVCPDEIGAISEWLASVL